MNADQTKAILTAATPAAAMVSLSQINEVAALVASIRANGMVDAAWTSAEDAGLKALGDYLKGKPDAVQVSGAPRLSLSPLAHPHCDPIGTRPAAQ